jgi:hypothetical protein
MIGRSFLTPMSRPITRINLIDEPMSCYDRGESGKKGSSCHCCSLGSLTLSPWKGKEEVEQDDEMVSMCLGMESRVCLHVGEFVRQ